MMFLRKVERFNWFSFVVSARFPLPTRSLIFFLSKRDVFISRFVNCSRAIVTFQVIIETDKLNCAAHKEQHHTSRLNRLPNVIPWQSISSSTDGFLLLITLLRLPSVDVISPGSLRSDLYRVLLLCRFLSSAVFTASTWAFNRINCYWFLKSTRGGPRGKLRWKHWKQICFESCKTAKMFIKLSWSSLQNKIKNIDDSSGLMFPWILLS